MGLFGVGFLVIVLVALVWIVGFQGDVLVCWVVFMGDLISRGVAWVYALCEMTYWFPPPATFPVVSGVGVGA